MRECRSIDVPCHRVIAAGGRLGGFGGNLQLKRDLLRAEGILVSGNRVKDFDVRRWNHKKPPPTARTGGLSARRNRRGQR